MPDVVASLFSFGLEELAVSLQAPRLEVDPSVYDNDSVTWTPQPSNAGSPNAAQNAEAQKIAQSATTVEAHRAQAAVALDRQNQAAAAGTEAVRIVAAIDGGHVFPDGAGRYYGETVPTADNALKGEDDLGGNNFTFYNSKSDWLHVTRHLTDTGHEILTFVNQESVAGYHNGFTSNNENLGVRIQYGARQADYTPIGSMSRVAAPTPEPNYGFFSGLSRQFPTLSDTFSGSYMGWRTILGDVSQAVFGRGAVSLQHRITAINTNDRAISGWSNILSGVKQTALDFGLVMAAGENPTMMSDPAMRGLVMAASGRNTQFAVNTVKAPFRAAGTFLEGTAMVIDGATLDRPDGYVAEGFSRIVGGGGELGLTFAPATRLVGRSRASSVVAADVAAIDNVLPQRPSGSPYYSVIGEAQLRPGTFTAGDGNHFRQANQQLYNQLQANPDYAATLEAQFPGINAYVTPGPRGGFAATAPKGLTWHHDPYRPGNLQLIAKAQHQAAGPIQNSLHPNQKGGRELWGGGQSRR